MKAGEIFVHGYRLSIKNTAVTGGPYQLDDGEKNDIRLFTGDVIFFHLFQ